MRRAENQNPICAGAGRPRRRGMGLALAPDIDCVIASISFDRCVVRDSISTEPAAPAELRGGKSVQGTVASAAVSAEDELDGGTARLHCGQSTELDDRSAARTG